MKFAVKIAVINKRWVEAKLHNYAYLCRNAACTLRDSEVICNAVNKLFLQLRLFYCFALHIFLFTLNSDTAHSERILFNQNKFVV